MNVPIMTQYDLDLPMAAPFGSASPFMAEPTAGRAAAQRAVGTHVHDVRRHQAASRYNGSNMQRIAASGRGHAGTHAGGSLVVSWSAAAPPEAL